MNSGLCIQGKKGCLYPDTQYMPKVMGFYRVLVIIVEFLLIIQGFIFIYKISGQKTAALRIPMWIAYLSCPVGMIFMLKITISRFINDIKLFFN